MNNLLLIALLATVIILCRLSGFILPRGTSPSWNQGLRFVPIAIFTALIISALYKDSHALNFKLIALLVAGLIMARTRRFGLSVAVGLGVLWLLLRMDA